MTLKPPTGAGTPLVRSGANDVQLAGARANDSTFDSTASIQALLDTVNYTVVPPGTYRIDGTLTIGEYRTLELMPGATLARLASGSASTAPVVRLNGANYSRLIGHGTVQSENSSPNGIVHVGPATQTVTANIQRWRVWDITILGDTPAATDIGLNITSSQVAGPTGSGAGSNYLGSVRDVDIRDVGVGIQEGELCNAHDFAGVVFHDIASSCYYLKGGSAGVSENSHYGGFTHTKYSGNITVIKAERALFCEFYGVKAEPDLAGVPGSLYYSLDANSSQCRIIGFGNLQTTTQGTDAGTNNVILDEDSFKLPGVVIGQAPSSGLGTGWVEVRRSDLAGAEYMFGQNTAGIVLINSKASDIRLRTNGTEHVRIGSGTLGFFGATPASKPSVTGSRAGNAALASLLTQLASLGLITDGSSA